MKIVASRQTAINRLTKRADEFFGMSLDTYIRRFVYVYDGRYCFNDNMSMQLCWLRLGCPVNESEARGNLPRKDAPLGIRLVQEGQQ